MHMHCVRDGGSHAVTSVQEVLFRGVHAAATGGIEAVSVHGYTSTAASKPYLVPIYICAIALLLIGCTNIFLRIGN